MSVFARAARGPRARLGGLAPFRALLLSWSGRGEAPQLTAAEPAGTPAPLPPAHLLPAFYLNELLLALTVRHDAQPELFDLYAATLAALGGGQALENTLRRFEKRLLDLIGYGVDFAAEVDTGIPVRADADYRFRAGSGVVAAGDVRAAGADGAGGRGGVVVSGRVLLGLASGAAFEDEMDGRQARALMRAALDHCLEGRELRTRTVARSLHRNEPLQEGRHP
jgi:DNA repair protein RecO (recombination protein O)